MTTAKKATTTRAKTTRKKPAEAAIPDLPNNPFIYQILEVISKQRSKAKKVEALKKYEAPVLKTIFIWNFDESVISVLPPGDVPYAAIDGETGFKGTLSEKIADAVSTGVPVTQISGGVLDGWPMVTKAGALGDIDALTWAVDRLRGGVEEMLAERPLMGITMGDPCGVGPEVILKALAQEESYRLCKPLVIGN